MIADGTLEIPIPPDRPVRRRATLAVTLFADRSYRLVANKRFLTPAGKALQIHKCLKLKEIKSGRGRNRTCDFHRVKMALWRLTTDAS